MLTSPSPPLPGTSYYQQCSVTRYPSPSFHCLTAALLDGTDPRVPAADWAAALPMPFTSDEAARLLHALLGGGHPG
jgi:hypothetical protein